MALFRIKMAAAGGGRFLVGGRGEGNGKSEDVGAKNPLEDEAFTG